jgi:hypothetical protein
MPHFLSDSIWVGVGLAVMIALVLIVLDIVAQDRAVFGRAPAIAEPGPEVSPRRPTGRRRRVVPAGLAIAVIVAGGAWFANGYAPLRTKGLETGSGALYLGTEPATYRGLDRIVLVNTGELPLTVVGIGDSSDPPHSWPGTFAGTPGAADAPPTIAESELLAPVGQEGTGSGAPFEIQAHASVRVVVVIRLRQCADWVATPTLAAGQSPSAQAALAAREAFGTYGLTYVPIAYDLLGLRHVSRVDMPAEFDMALMDQAGCGGAHNVPGSTPAPTVIYP